MNRLFDKLPFIGKIIPGKISLSFLMVSLSICLFLIFKTYDRALCVLALFFSFSGDLLLNNKQIPSKQRKSSLILGATSFTLAHIFFFFAYLNKIMENNYYYFNKGVILAFLILLSLTFFLIFSTNNPSNLFVIGLIYLWITGINYITIFSYSFSAQHLVYLPAFGGMLFLISDVIIGLENFSTLKSRLARELIWWLYPIGQILIIIFA